MPSTVPALVTEGAEKPLERSTIERRDLGPHDVLIEIAFAGICHSDIHPAATSGARRTSRWSPATRSPAPSTRSAPRSPSTRSATASASAAWSTRAASARTARPARSSTASRATSAPTTAIGHDGDARPTAATARTSSSTRTSCSRIPEGIDARRGRAAAVRRHHALLAAEPLGRRPGQEGRHRRHGRPRPHGRQDRARHGRRGHRARRRRCRSRRTAEASAPTTTTPPATTTTFDEARGHAST